MLYVFIAAKTRRVDRVQLVMLWGLLVGPPVVNRTANKTMDTALLIYATLCSLNADARVFTFPESSFPSIQEDTPTHYVPVNGSVTFTCPQCSMDSIQVFRNGHQVLLGHTIRYQEDGSVFIGGFSTELEGSYHCACSTPLLDKPAKVSAAVHLRAAWVSPGWVISPPSIQFSWDGNVLLRCPSTEGWYPIPVISIEKQGVSISIGKHRRISTSGRYSCVAENPAGRLRSAELLISRFDNLQASLLRHSVRLEPSPSLISVRLEPSPSDPPSVFASLWPTLVCSLAAMAVFAFFMVWLAHLRGQNLAAIFKRRRAMMRCRRPQREREYNPYELDYRI